MPHSALHEPVLAWYAEHARDLPWRSPAATPWGILVSEFMLQQTPVARVLPAWDAWLERWPQPASLAAEAPGEAVRQWGRLGYPRRALRLHGTARAIVQRHGGQVPGMYEELLALPGVGSYTAAAVASFAFGARHAVVDTNVRRLHARAVAGQGQGGAAPSNAELRLAESLVPDEPAVAARWAVAGMELGALVCTARAPRCDQCPVVHLCAWRAAGQPGHTGPPPRRQTFSGTDRQARGVLLALLREADGPVPRADLELAWTANPDQCARALESLVADGLAETMDHGTYGLPTRDAG